MTRRLPSTLGLAVFGLNPETPPTNNQQNQPTPPQPKTPTNNQQNQPTPPQPKTPTNNQQNQPTPPRGVRVESRKSTVVARGSTELTDDKETFAVVPSTLGLAVFGLNPESRLSWHGALQN
ncbi:hypothetical protein J6590_087629 [Homalodisca vitripennis]|nr:hypothetical protein J6590_087629 [Homalodisca vitripennis]